MGKRLPRCSSRSFASKTEEGVPAEIREALLPLLQIADAVTDCIQEYDRKVEEMASQKYGHTKLLRQVKAWADYRSGLRIDVGKSGALRQESGRRTVSGARPKARGFRGESAAIGNQ